MTTQALTAEQAEKSLAKGLEQDQEEVVAHVVDMAIGLDLEVKALGGQLDKLKRILKAYAERVGAHSLKGTRGTAVISDTLVRSLDYEGLEEYLTQEGKAALLPQFLKVEIGKVSEAFGDEPFIDNGSIITKAFHRLTFEK